MKISVLDAATLGSDLDLSPLNEFGDVQIFRNTAPEDVADRIREADTVILNKVKLNESNLGQNHSVRQICIAATGYDNVDTAYCRSRGIAVCNVVGYSTNNVTQLTVSMVLYLINHLAEYTRDVRDGTYSHSGVANKLSPPYHEIAGKTWGIIGYGHIGKKVGEVARALGCRVIAFKRTPEKGTECVDLDTLCRESDIISVHLPLNESTKRIISAERIALMKKQVLFVNVARGAVTDEKALADSLSNNRIGGLGVDVYSREPFGEDHPFYPIRENDNVCLTPHMAWGSIEARERCLQEIVLNIRAFQAGERRSRVD